MDFRSEIILDTNFKCTGKLYDLNTLEEYTNFRIKSITNGFTQQVKSKYIEILKDICLHCCEKQEYLFDQANRIGKWITSVYHIQPEFLWEKYPTYGVYRNLENQKWLALIGNVNKKVFDKTCDQLIEFINIKLPKEKVKFLQTMDGFYSAYHMNKVYWITIVLDNSLTDETIGQWITESFLENTTVKK